MEEQYEITNIKNVESLNPTKNGYKVFFKCPGGSNPQTRRDLIAICLPNPKPVTYDNCVWAQDVPRSFTDITKINADGKSGSVIVAIKDRNKNKNLYAVYGYKCGKPRSNDWVPVALAQVKDF